MTTTSPDSQHTVPPAPWVEHTGDGTLVHDTERDDTDMQQALGDNGFRWSRNLNAWYLPRPWTWAFRSMRVRDLVAALEREDRTIRVEETRERQRSSDEIAADQKERAEVRAERYADRAARAQANSDALWNEAREMAKAIPLGQPVLMDHYSAPRDLRYRARIDAKENKSSAERKRADYLSRRAAAAEQTAKGDTPAVIARRIERLKADRRRIERYIGGTQSPWTGPATGDQLERLQAEAADLDEQIAFDVQQLAEAEKSRGRLWTPDDIRVGDEVRISGRWYPVKRVNRKTVSVPPLIGMGSTDYSWTDTVPYSSITGRRRDGVDTRNPEPEKD